MELESGMKFWSLVVFVTVVCALAVGLAACGGSGSSSTSGGSTSEETAEAPAETEKGEAETTGETAGGTSEGGLAKLFEGNFENPPATAPTLKKPANVYFISCGQAAEGCNIPATGAEEAAKALGWKLTVVDGKFGAGNAYNTGLQQAVAAHAEAIILLGIGCNQALTGLEAAAAAKIPVIGAQSFDCDDPKVEVGKPLFASSVEYSKATPSTAEYVEAAGRAGAEYLIAKLGGEVKAITVGLKGPVQLEYQEEGFLEALEECETCEVVDRVLGVPPDLENGKLKGAFATALSQNPDANVVWSSDDGVALPAEVPQAVRASGRGESVTVLSAGGCPPGTLELISGNLGMTANLCGTSVQWLGWAAVDETLRVLAGEKSAPEGMGFQLVDAEHMPEGESWEPPIDYKAGYEKAWGVAK
ncbi:MAG TPA: sugar ABC transporter substrate-binding protein [Solirubrobacterales bacterium]|jgi:ribose transport system substrate-binding protein